MRVGHVIVLFVRGFHFCFMNAFAKGQRLYPRRHRHQRHPFRRVGQLVQQPLLQIPAVDQDHIRAAYFRQGGGRGLVAVGILPGLHQRHQLDRISAHLGGDVADNARRGDDA